jgi:hypothetical protein
VIAGEAGASGEQAVIAGEADAAVLRAFEADFAFVKKVGQRRAVASVGADQAADDAFGGLEQREECDSPEGSRPSTRQRRLDADIGPTPCF